MIRKFPAIEFPGGNLMRKMSSRPQQKARIKGLFKKLLLFLTFCCGLCCSSYANFQVLFPGIFHKVSLRRVDNVRSISFTFYIIKPKYL